MQQGMVGEMLEIYVPQNYDNVNWTSIPPPLTPKTWYSTVSKYFVQGSEKGIGEGREEISRVYRDRGERGKKEGMNTLIFLYTFKTPSAPGTVALNITGMPADNFLCTNYPSPFFFSILAALHLSSALSLNLFVQD